MVVRFQSLFTRIHREEKSEDSVAISRNDNGTAAGDAARPLSAVADAFEALSAAVKANGSNFDLELVTFCNACSHVSILFGCLGIAFKFAELEYTYKVRNLLEASESYRTLNNIIEYDIQNDTIKKQGSLTRNLRRVRQGLDLVRAVFQNFLSSTESCLKEVGLEAYRKTCAPYHTWAVRTAAYAGMYALPTRDQLLLKLNESGESAKREMSRYMNASIAVIEYIDNLYRNRNIRLDW